MPILTVLLVLICIGLLLWAVNKYVPMAASIKNIFNVVAIVLTIIWLLKVFGVFAYLQNVHI
jgi:hypothetical protein